MTDLQIELSIGLTNRKHEYFFSYFKNFLLLDIIFYYLQKVWWVLDKKNLSKVNLCYYKKISSK